MAPPSQLSIATSSLQRLVKEEASYFKELQQQEARLEKTQASEDENVQFQVKQEVRTYFGLPTTPDARHGASRSPFGAGDAFPGVARDFVSSAPA